LIPSVSIGVDADHQVRGLGGHMRAVADLDHQRVDEHHRVDA
jgi:hypothetical protein